MLFAILYEVDKGDLIGKVMWEQRPTRRQEASPAYVQGKNVSSKAWSNCKSSEAGVCGNVFKGRQGGQWLEQ